MELELRIRSQAHINVLFLIPDSELPNHMEGSFMLATIKTAAVCGLESVPVDVEVDVAKMSFPAFTVVGLAGKAIDEARERVRSALKNSGAEFPQHRITVNLAPADLPKNGPSFDLPMALGLLVASEQIAYDAAGRWFAGELSLDGAVRPVAGVLPMAALAKRMGATELFVPADNAMEAGLIDGVAVYGVRTLKELVLHVTGVAKLEPMAQASFGFQESGFEDERLDRDDLVDMADILGQEGAKRALEIAAAGGHNVLMQGLPGSGKTLLARSFQTILPPMVFDEALEVSTIYSVAGMLGREPLMRRRPFRSPHHTTSNIGLIGGGADPKPGEVSLAHRGVLFLDEFAEFPRMVLEALRQPLEDGVITVSRAKASYTFPARFQLLAAQNPCPCGHLGDPHKPCSCTSRQVLAYQKRVSGPILDRIDLFVQVPRVEQRHFANLGKQKSESSAEIRQRVAAAREKQGIRFGKVAKSEVLEAKRRSDGETVRRQDGGNANNESRVTINRSKRLLCNAEMGSWEVKEFCRLDEQGEQLMQLAVSRLQLSARAYFRVLKVARTIADLAGSERVETAHLSEALQYRAMFS